MLRKIAEQLIEAFAAATLVAGMVYIALFNLADLL